MSLPFKTTQREIQKEIQKAVVPTQDGHGMLPTEKVVTVATVHNPAQSSVSTNKMRASTPLSNADYVPCNWGIIPEGNDTVSCKNNVTGKTFTGTIREFSDLIQQK
jgi:hypothetical protein